MGIGDLYGGFAPYGPCYRPAAAVTAEMPACDIMRTHFREDWFTPNDLEMACLAFAQNAPQSHVRTGLWKGLRRPSAAVRGERIDLARESARRQRRPLADCSHIWEKEENDGQRPLSPDENSSPRFDRFCYNRANYISTLSFRRNRYGHF